MDILGSANLKVVMGIIESMKSQKLKGSKPVKAVEMMSSTARKQKAFQKEKLFPRVTKGRKGQFN